MANSTERLRALAVLRDRAAPGLFDTHDLDFAWAVGLFEGEGCIGTTKNHYCVRLTLVSTDEDVVRRFQHVVGFGRLNGPHKGQGPNSKPSWVWAKSGQEAELFLAEMLPFMCERRASRAREVIALRADVLAKRFAIRTCSVCGREFRPVAFNAHQRAKPREHCSKNCWTRANRAKKRAYMKQWKARQLVSE